MPTPLVLAPEELPIETPPPDEVSLEAPPLGVLALGLLPLELLVLELLLELPESPEPLCDHARGTQKSASTATIDPSCRFILPSSYPDDLDDYGITRVSCGRSTMFCAIFLPLITSL
jgi:hypothetical protein